MARTTKFSKDDILEKSVEFIKEHKENCSIATGNLDCWIEKLSAKIGCECFCSSGKMENDKVYLTDEGFLELEQELNELKNVRRPEVIKALKEARALGDLSENAEYDAARQEQAQTEARIKELEAMIEHAVIIENVDTNEVSIGTKVTIEYVGDDDTEEYSIVGVKEADPFNNKISNESPIAAAILNKKVGTTVEVSSPDGVYKVKIVNVN